MSLDSLQANDSVFDDYSLQTVPEEEAEGSVFSSPSRPLREEFYSSLERSNERVNIEQIARIWEHSHKLEGTPVHGLGTSSHLYNDFLGSPIGNYLMPHLLSSDGDPLSGLDLSRPRPLSRPITKQEPHRYWRESSSGCFSLSSLSSSFDPDQSPVRAIQGPRKRAQSVPFGTDTSAASATGSASPQINPREELYRTRGESVGDLARAAACNRAAAHHNDPRGKWKGEIPTRPGRRAAEYSTKVFLGGVPWKDAEWVLRHSFQGFNVRTFEFPEGGSPFRESGERRSGGGYAYVIFESKSDVEALVQTCRHVYHDGLKLYFPLKTFAGKEKEVQVQVIPWNVNDANFYGRGFDGQPDPSHTVFVGALHGQMTAFALAHVMQQLFGPVAYAGIDVDQHKYPIGSGRVTFERKDSYIRAISVHFLRVETPRFQKTLQIDPYLSEEMCEQCRSRQGIYFCRDCLTYYCPQCWKIVHTLQGVEHTPLTRIPRATKAQLFSLSL